MADAQLAGQVEQTNVFAKLSPVHKERIIKALQQKNHVVGFMGDGINDAPALKAADTGISVDTAVSPLAAGMGLVPLPPLYWLLASLMLMTYVVLTQLTRQC